jgi:hypothetical protein
MSRDDPRYGRWIELTAAEILEHGTCKEYAEYIALAKIALEDCCPGCFMPIRDPNADVQYDAHYEDRGR